MADRDSGPGFLSVKRCRDCFRKSLA
ncbi:MAG: hypothetical protein ACI91J_003318, partial [Yoonia sp.]